MRAKREAALKKPSPQLDWLVERERNARDQANEELRALRQVQRRIAALEAKVKSQALVIDSARKALRSCRGLPMTPTVRDAVWAACRACSTELGLAYRDKCECGELEHQSR